MYAGSVPVEYMFSVAGLIGSGGAKQGRWPGKNASALAATLAVKVVNNKIIY